MVGQTAHPTAIEANLYGSSDFQTGYTQCQIRKDTTFLVGDGGQVHLSKDIHAYAHIYSSQKSTMLGFSRGF